MYDGHVHTPYCPHGSNHPLRAYVEQALKLGYKGLTFAEHAPLPEGFNDPVPAKDSAMEQGKLSAYLDELRTLKKEYKKDIPIRIGLEVDFIEGFEEETHRFLNETGPYLDDSILSVHFLKAGGKYTCLDYSPESFGELVTELGSLEAVYDQYFKTLTDSVKASLGTYKPRRIGHPSLVRKFHRRFPVSFPVLPKITALYKEIKAHNLAIDVNGAGLIKPLCGETYPYPEALDAAEKLGIPLVYGSDAHAPSQLGTGAVFLHGRVSPVVPD
ncbi:histidinol-phosphatase HisJ [Alteribacter natronophilus]|uniref:histidinol-phosphatase HisJ n=1 Tax=Alteribacter natronophilus TaxID=2583810 RepID=UPI00110DE831|nr:histidinol-phosphatase HisJ [Alteribacter natronophilus]TMW71739.1 histidinol-phosphatase HisJ [Alteribacter natronophilus]